jgi:uncharacterized membrane protein
MIPFFTLLITTLFFRLLGILGVAYFATWQHALRGGLAIMFLLTASAHWGRLRPDLIRMVPPGFPSPATMVTLTGLAEIVGAVGILWQKTAPWAAAGLILLLLAVFPANVYAARHSLTLGGRPVPTLPVRTLLQIIFLAAIFVAGFY